ncbi:hypothetical protein BC834DRAFT_871688, partial [Gloeopeniophorella convolvens]
MVRSLIILLGHHVPALGIMIALVQSSMNARYPSLRVALGHRQSTRGASVTPVGGRWLQIVKLQDVMDVIGPPPQSF